MTDHPLARVSLDDYFAFVSQPQHAQRAFELIDGVFVEKMPTSFLSSWLAAQMVYFIRAYLQTRPIGYVVGADGTFQMTNGDILIPDVAFISHQRMPALPERIALTPPDLAVEVMSPTDKVKHLRLKAQRYLDHGTRLVWLVFPHTQTVEVYDGDDDVLTLTPADTLTGGSVLLNFALPLVQLFPLSEQPRA